MITHFILINAAVGAATGNDRVVSFSPDYCSVTRLRVQAGSFELVAQGRTRVL